MQPRIQSLSSLIYDSSLAPFVGISLLWTHLAFWFFGRIGFGWQLGPLDDTHLWTPLLDTFLISMFEALLLGFSSSKAQGLFHLACGEFRSSYPISIKSVASVVDTKEERMVDNSDNMNNYSPKTKKVMRHVKRVEDKLVKLGGDLESMRIDTQSVNAKVETLSRGKGMCGFFMHESEGSRSESPNISSNRSYRSQKSERSERPRRERRREEDELKR
ncbi:hypothetical protein CR513_21719, partial [Mucuna pruriens]